MAQGSAAPAFIRAALVASIWSPLTAVSGPDDQDIPYTVAEGAASIDPTGDVIAGSADRFSRMTVPVTIEGKGPFRFMIDTGSQATVVSRRLSEQLGLPSLGHATVVGMAARKRVELVRLDGLELASRMFDNLHAPLLEAEHMGADGIIGLDSLQGLRVMIDFRADSISVDDARALGGNRGYEIVVRARKRLGRLIIADAQIDGVRTALVIDTGSQGSIGNLALQRKLRAAKGVEVTSTDVTGSEIVGRLDVPRTLQIGRTSGRNLMLKGLAITPPVVGRISIGRVVEKNGKRLPEKDDEFTLTSQIQHKDGWITHPLDEALRGSSGAKLRSIPIKGAANLEGVALVVAWFGTDLRAGDCRVLPGVMTSSAMILARLPPQRETIVHAAVIRTAEVR